MQRRRHWFERFDGAYMALWWVPAGHIPGIEEARERLDHLRAHGPTSFAFSFARPFSAPGEDVIRMAEGIEAVCGA